MGWFGGTEYTGSWFEGGVYGTDKQYSPTKSQIVYPLKVIFTITIP